MSELPLLPVPHGWIQWNDTQVCMDVHCECGKSSHLDADFAYNVRCPHCGAVFAVDGCVRMTRLTPKEVEDCPCIEDADP